MINFNRIYAMILRHIFNMRHSFDRLGDMFYWPALDLFIWGLTGLYFARLSSNTHETTFVILAGLVFWVIMWRGSYEISTNLLTEIWDKNLVNIFASPLTLTEWTISFLLFGTLKMFASLIFSSTLAYFFYQYNILMYGLLLIPFCFSLLITGWVVGFIVSGFLIKFGEKIQTIAWMGVGLIAPFAALYYPVSTLPLWAQKIAMFVPASYIMEGVREATFTGKVSPDKLLISFALNTVYLVLSIWFFLWMFKRSKKLGFGRLI